MEGVGRYFKRKSAPIMKIHQEIEPEKTQPINEIVSKTELGAC